MNRFRCWTTIAILILLLHQGVSAENGKGSAAGEGELIGIIRLKTTVPLLDRHARAQIDRLVPRLIKSGQGKIVRIEGQVAAAPRGGTNVADALLLAMEVEKYLRKQHKLQLDFYLAAGNNPSNTGRTVKIMLYPNSFTEQSCRQHQ
jgi:hypothetical protein